MRNLVSLVLATSFLMISCNKEDDSQTNNSKIAIKASIPGSSQKSAGLKSANALSLSDAKKALVFNSTGYELFNIENGTVTAYATAGTATAIAFLDAGNRYIGCLCSGGLNVLPLVSLKDGENTIIDLSNLSLEGTSVIPANNPIGNEIVLSAEEIARYKELGAYYESLSKNIDCDNDGLPDLLSKKFFNISSVFQIHCGSFGLNNTPPQVNDTASFFINYKIRIAGGKSLIPTNTDIEFSGPEGSPYNDIVQEGYSPAPDGFISAFVRQSTPPAGYPFGSAFLPFRQGKYTITLDAKNYTLNYSNINAKYFFILALPTIHTNDRNEIISVSVEYRDMEDDVVDAENFVYQTQITLRDGNTQISQMGALWENPETKTNNELYNFVLPAPVPLSDLHNISVMYVDLIGNSYEIGFMP